MYIMLGPRTSRIMVAQAEASQEAPVSLVSGNANSAWATTIGLASYVVAAHHTKESKHMENTSTSQPSTNTLTLYRQLFNQLDLSTLDTTQLLDLAALSAEQAEGLCHSLMLFSDLLQNNPQTDDTRWEQLNHYLNATAHLVPALCNLYARALRQMECQS